MERFWSKIRIADWHECWPFLGHKDAKGYGRFWFSGESCRAHRVSFRLVHGVIPDGDVVMHSCDNPPCCNPAHLSAGTQRRNAADAHARGLIRYRPERSRTAKLTPEIVAEVRQRLAVGELQREIGAGLGVDQTTISRIKLNQTWRAS